MICNPRVNYVRVNLLFLMSVSLLLLSPLVSAQTKALPLTEAGEQRIISLSPHLTEIAFALGKGEHIIAVSDYSDYPEAASKLPSVASYEGANIADIIRLQPTHVLVWRGGNKDADIERLKSIGMHVYESHVDSVASLMSDITFIGEFIGAQDRGQMVRSQLENTINAIAQAYKDRKTNAVYYLSSQPLVGLGNDKWLNSLLNLCSITNVYANSPSAYPQLQMQNIIRQQPNAIIAASKAPTETVEGFWAAHKQILKSTIVSANPDALHRFTPRAIDEMARVCSKVYE